MNKNINNIIEQNIKDFYYEFIDLYLKKSLDSYGKDYHLSLAIKYHLDDLKKEDKVKLKRVDYIPNMGKPNKQANWVVLNKSDVEKLLSDNLSIVNKSILKNNLIKSSIPLFDKDQFSLDVLTSFLLKNENKAYFFIKENMNNSKYQENILELAKSVKFGGLSSKMVFLMSLMVFHLDIDSNFRNYLLNGTEHQKSQVKQVPLKDMNIIHDNLPDDIREKYMTIKNLIEYNNELEETSLNSTFFENEKKEVLQKINLLKEMFIKDKNSYLNKLDIDKENFKSSKIFKISCFVNNMSGKELTINEGFENNNVNISNMGKVNFELEEKYLKYFSNDFIANPEKIVLEYIKYKDIKSTEKFIEAMLNPEKRVYEPYIALYLKEKRENYLKENFKENSISLSRKKV